MELWWLLIGWVVAGPEKNVLLPAAVYRVSTFLLDYAKETATSDTCMRTCSSVSLIHSHRNDHFANTLLIIAVPLKLRSTDLMF